MATALQLRAATQPLHDRVDAAFGGFGLADAAGYRRFLHALALALPAVEAALAAVPGLPAWRPRTPLLAADLADLGEAMPAPLPFTLPAGVAADGAAAWGALYVSEGSRLGGAMMARSVLATLPSRYLAAAHLPGEWRSLRAAIDAAGEAGGARWVAGAKEGATATFALYERAAAT